MQWIAIISLSMIVTWLFFCRRNSFRRYFSTLFLAALGIALAVSMVLAPEAAFASALDGLKVWWDIVFPALLPFFIGSELLMGLGVVNFMGVMLEPLMRPLFNVPGAGSFVMAMGLASGYPIGAILTRRLRQEGMCNRIEAERLLSFCNTADPLFMIGAVAVGMFGNPQLGVIIAMAHYISSLMVGICMRFYGRNLPSSPQTDDKKQGNMLIRALKELYRARQKDGRPLGQLLGDAVKNSVNSLLMIGGFIILFSVVMRMATVSGLVATIGRSIDSFLCLLGMSSNLGNAAVSGIFEITIGCNVASQALAPLAQRVIMASAIIAWSGLSVHAQVAAILNDTDIQLGPYICARLLHAFFAGAVTWLLWNRWYNTAAIISLPVFLQTQPNASLHFWWQRLTFTSWRVGLLTTIILTLSLAYHTLSNLHVVIWRRR